MHIWCAISGHGYGHAAQVVPVLHALDQLVTALLVTLRTTVPVSFFHDRLRTQWTYSYSEQDIGCIQQGPLHINVKKTWEAHQQFHTDWETRVQLEREVLASASPDLLLSDISYLAIEAGTRASIPSIALATLTWDTVLNMLSDPENSDHRMILDEIKGYYRKADKILLPYPALPLVGFTQTQPIGSIFEKHPVAKQELRKAIGAQPGEQVVLVGFGGVPLETMPFQELEGFSLYRFIVSGPVPDGLTRVTSSSHIPLPFNTLLASADIVITKPGYSTIIDCVALSKPVVYVRRYNFADEEGLVQYLHQYGRAVELSLHHFLSGQWKDALLHVVHLPWPQKTAPSQTGAWEAAEILARFE